MIHITPYKTAVKRHTLDKLLPAYAIATEDAISIQYVGYNGMIVSFLANNISLTSGLDSWVSHRSIFSTQREIDTILAVIPNTLGPRLL